MNEWIYRTVTINTEYKPDLVETLTGYEGNPPVQSMLNSMGADGWELVGLLPAQPVDKTWIDPFNNKQVLHANPWIYHAIFKKPAALAEAQRKRQIENDRLKKRARGRISN
jgi:hypothetical protein